MRGKDRAGFELAIKVLLKGAWVFAAVAKTTLSLFVTACHTQRPTCHHLAPLSRLDPIVML